MTHSESNGMHTISHVVSTKSCYRAQKKVWPLVNNVMSVQIKEMTGQTSDVAVISF